MGFVQVMTALAVLAALAFPALANDIYVGDQYGWQLNFDYQNWAKGREFYVGDRLIFVYNADYHNVLKISNGPDFQQCVKPYGVGAFTGGYTVITLATPGRKWYVCGVANHCSYGMKLVIDVYPPKKNEYKHNKPHHQKQYSAPYSKNKYYTPNYPKKNYNAPDHH